VMFYLDWVVDKTIANVVADNGVVCGKIQVVSDGYFAFSPSHLGFFDESLISYLANRLESLNEEVYMDLCEEEELKLNEA